MINMFSTLMKSFSAKAEDRIVDEYAVELIEQKVREAEAGLAGAKRTLASLIMRQRSEEKILNSITARARDLEKRATAALDAGRDELAQDAAEAIADIENEASVRRATMDELERRVSRTKMAVEKAHRRIIDLKQGLITARAIDADRRTHKSLDRSLSNGSAIHEAEALIARVTNSSDPLEESNILDEIDSSLSKADIGDRMARAGFGEKSKIEATDVIARLKSQQN
ncbi:PspA/IM30 family protein [Maritalea myrionectae]|uniref:PspA/IM30 family protein n=1 Tax=Maritalea myrionectae TaxID=454601 RepID=UPI00040E9847|nr:PspA/IM30 family protein [Maritalea myrionectae]